MEPKSEKVVVTIKTESGNTMEITANFDPSVYLEQPTFYQVLQLMMKASKKGLQEKAWEYTEEK